MIDRGGPRLGVLDWGIGGMSVFRPLRLAHPDLPVLYLSDAGAVPYGRQDRARLAARIARVSSWMAGAGVTHLVIACNAASTVAGVSVTPHTTGVIDHGVRATLRTGARCVGVIGGARTVRAGHHRRQLTEAGVRVHQRIAQPLSAAVERGELEGADLRGAIKQILAPLRAVDALLMACTHYPALAHHFARELPAATLVDPAEATVAWVIDQWLPALTPGAGAEDRFVTTGDASRMALAAEAAFGVRLAEVERVVI